MAIRLSQGVTRKLRPRGLLLEALNMFDATAPTQGAEQANPLRWLDGVSFPTRPCTGPNGGIIALDPCAGGFGTVNPIGCTAWVTQEPFQIVDAVSDSELGTLANTYTLAELLIEREAELRSWAFAKALIGPVVTTGTHTLSESAHAPASHAFGAAVSLTSAIRYLEAELALMLRGVQGIIYMPPSILHQATYKAGLVPVGAHWETPAGTTVVSDAGFEGAPQPTGQSAAGAGETWLYASGPVEYQYHNPGPTGDEPREYTDIHHNVVERYLQTMGILIFDLCPITAVLTTYDT